MVQVCTSLSLESLDHEKCQAWLETISASFKPSSKTILKKVLDYLLDYGIETQPVTKGLEIAVILADLKAAHQAIAAAMLWPLLMEQAIDLSFVELNFSKGIKDLLQAADQLQFAPLRMDIDPDKHQKQIDSKRKMLLSMINDVQVVLLKCAERLVMMRHLDAYDKPHKAALATEVLSIYAPLANRLGISQIKWQLEDLAFMHLHRSEYRLICQQLTNKRLKREAYIDQALQTLQHALQKQDISAELSGRPKHIYSIWRKLTQKNLSFEALYDLRAMRILVEDIKTCYRALALVHELWAPLTKEFDDYIAHPKANGYQSIHTIVVGPGDKHIEIQIRTHSMHEENELGVAAHWRYKEGSSLSSQSHENRILWLRSLLAWQEETGLGQKEDAARLSEDVIYVFSPKGEVIDLPCGATPLDFAYSIHTDVGHRTRGAKVNGKLVPLNYTLETGEQVEIITGNETKPSRDWLGAKMIYVVSSKAKSKIAHWFRRTHRDLYIQEGKENLIKALKQAHITRVDYDALTKKYNFQNVEDLFAAIGTGDVKIGPIIDFLQLAKGHVALEKEATVPVSLAKPSMTKSQSLTIDGVDNLLFSMAGCCKPVYGDQVVGYITQGRGISVHRSDCKQLAIAMERAPDHIVEVDWGRESTGRYSVVLFIHAPWHQELLRQVSQVLSQHKVPLTAIDRLSAKGAKIAKLKIAIEVYNQQELLEVQKYLKQLKGVTEVGRS